MTHNALKSIDLTKFMKILMCFLVSCSNGGGHVSLVRTMVFRRNLLSFSSFVHFKIMWLTLRLLMSYIYGAPSKARNANVVYIWTYVWQR